MQKRTLPLFASLMLILAVAVTGCAAAPASMSDAGETTVTWAMWGSPAELATHQSVADAYMAENSNVNIEILAEPWSDYFTKIQALWAGGDEALIPDVLFLWPTPQYAAEGVLENLQPYIERDGYNLDDYWPALLESARYNGDVYGFPRDIGLEVLYYNKDIFDEVGVPYPDETWTWTDLMSAADQLKIVDDSGRVSRYGLGMEGGKYMLWVLQNRGALLDDYRNPSACVMTEPQAVEALQFFADLMSGNAAMTSSGLSQAGGDAAVFQSGQVAMIIQNGSRVSAFNSAEMNYDVAVVPIPEGGQRAASAGGAAWVMSSGSDDKEAAWHFLQWLQSTDGGQRIYTASGEIFPALQSTAMSDAFLKPDEAPANRQAFLTEGRNAKVGRFGYFPEWGYLNGNLVAPHIDKIWIGEMTPAEAAAAICEGVDQFLADEGFPR